MIKIPEGAELRGILDGKGGQVTVADPNTGEPRPLDTWRIRSHAGDVTAILLDCAQFQSRFGGLPKGTHVVIQRCGTVKSSKGRNVNDYMIYTKLPAPSNVVGEVRP